MAKTVRINSVGKVNKQYIIDYTVIDNQIEESHTIEFNNKSAFKDWVRDGRDEIEVQLLLLLVLNWKSVDATFSDESLIAGKILGINKNTLEFIKS